MSKQKLIQQVADKYRREGFDVILTSDDDQLPDFLKGQEVDLIGRKGGESVAIQVKGRDELYDIPAFAETMHAQPGWSFDLVVYPPEGDEFPRDEAHTAPEYTSALIAEAEQLSSQGAVNAALVIAWSATEAAMREAAQREGIELDKLTPRFVLKTLHADGVITREECKQASEYLDLRNQVVHGFRPAVLPDEAPRFLLDLAKRLQSGEAVH